MVGERPVVVEVDQDGTESVLCLCPSGLEGQPCAHAANVSKRGMSVSLGSRGATTIIGRRGIRHSVNPLPGSGLSWWGRWRWTGKKHEAKGDKA
jgi:hypothetical protein